MQTLPCFFMELWLIDEYISQMNWVYYIMVLCDMVSWNSWLVYKQIMIQIFLYFYLFHQSQEIVQVPQLDKSQFFSKGIFYQVLSLITGSLEKTAVFVNTSLLSGLQLATLQRVWQVPVYDRFVFECWELLFGLREGHEKTENVYMPDMHLSSLLEVC